LLVAEVCMIDASVKKDASGAANIFALLFVNLVESTKATVAI